jgi:hypothetical protein
VAAGSNPLAVAGVAFVVWSSSDEPAPFLATVATAVAVHAGLATGIHDRLARTAVTLRA